MGFALLAGNHTSCDLESNPRLQVISGTERKAFCTGTGRDTKPHYSSKVKFLISDDSKSRFTGEIYKMRLKYLIYLEIRPIEFCKVSFGAVD